MAGGAKGAAKVLANLLDPPPASPAVKSAWGAASQRLSAETAAKNASVGTVGLAVMPPPRPSVSLRDVAAPWYGNAPGGFDQAVSDSQEAMLAYPLANYAYYGGWEAAAADRKFPLVLKDIDAAGRFNTQRNRVEIHPATEVAGWGPTPVLEHEVTHGLTLAHHHDELNRQYPDNPTPQDRARLFEALAADGGGGDTFWNNSGNEVDLDDTLLHLINKKHSAGPDDARAHVDEHLRNYIRPHADYLTEARELDPRIAEVRRHYAWNTGEGVRSPEEAEKAWKWFGDNLQGIKEANSASMTPMAYRLYDGLPEGVKRIMYARMTHIPSVLGPVGAASMVAGQDRE